MTSGPPPSGSHGSVAEEIAALADALRARTFEGGGPAGAGARRTEQDGGRGPQHEHGHEHEHDAAHEHDARARGPAMCACDICPVCRAIALLHTVSPTAVTALADLAHQAELTLRALAEDLQARGEDGFAPPREDIPVDDLGDDLGDDLTDE